MYGGGVVMHKISLKKLKTYEYEIINNEKELKAYLKSNKKNFFVVKHPIKENKAIAAMDFAVHMSQKYGIFYLGMVTKNDEDQNNLWFLFRKNDALLKKIGDRGID